jgi:hypothetical protein
VFNQWAKHSIISADFAVKKESLPTKISQYYTPLSLYPPVSKYNIQMYDDK